MSAPLYSVGDRVLVESVYELRESLYVIKLERPVIAEVVIVGKKCSEPFGYPYTLRLSEEIRKKYNIAGVCYWETDILDKVEPDEDLFWQTWGDR